MVFKSTLRPNFQFALIIGFVKRYHLRIMLVILAVLLILGFGRHVVLANNTKPRITEGAIGTFTENDLPNIVLNLISQPLVNVGEDEIPVPNLVESFSSNKEATNYTFKLKNNLFWSDGTKINAKDLNIVIPDTKFQALDDRNFEFKLADSFSPLPSLLSKPVLKKGSITGLGPYSVSKIDKDPLNGIFITRIFLTATDPNLPNVVIRFYSNEKNARNALKIGEVSALLGVSDSGDFLSQKPFAESSKVNFTRLVGIFYNTKDPILSDRNYRLALGFAAPSIKNEVEAKTSIPPKSWAFNADIRDFLDNPDQAKNYLAKVKHGLDETLILTTIPSLKPIGEKIVSEWNKQGINSVLRVESGIPQNFQALLIPQDIRLDPDQYSLWHSTQGRTNISQYASPNQYSPRVDKDLEDGRKSSDMEIRKARYQDMQKVLADDAPATFLYFPKYKAVFLKKIEPQIKKVLEIQLRDL